MDLRNTPTTYFAPEKAEAAAAELTAQDDDGWTYKVDHDPKGTGYSRIIIHDEAGEFVSYF